ncbi:hypothetical protein ASC64_07150 [Nocardioides sp. Root122]|nr:hypothetical protein ASC64_07150 [Nocardioides sp. Root122]
MLSSIATGLALAVVSPANATDARSSTRQRPDAGTTLITATDHVAFSPDGDHRKDRGRIRFRLDAPARVTITVRNPRRALVRRARLGTLSAGRHSWTWDGRTDGGRRVRDNTFSATSTAVTGPRRETARSAIQVDTQLSGRLVATRPTVYPRASVVTDRVQLMWLSDGWNAWDEELFWDDGLLARSRLEIRTQAGELVWRRVIRNSYTPVFDWYGRRDGGALLPPGGYVVQVVVSDPAGNRSRDRQDVWVSHEQLAEEIWSATVAAARAGRYSPEFGGCNGCGESAGPVPSERFPDGLSFRPATESWQWGTAGYFGMDVPFAESPADTYRVTATGGPTVPGSPDQGRLDGIDVGPGDATVTAQWRSVSLTGDPFLPAMDLPVTWTFITSPENSYDVATFTVEYRRYVPAG